VSFDQPLAGYDIVSGEQRGARFSLYPNRLVLAGAESMETIPLAHLASVRVAFERDARKLNWAIGLALVALVLALLSSPLQAWMQALANSAGAGGADDSLRGVLVAVFNAIGKFARLFVPTALVCFGVAAALVFFFWLGQTTLRLAFAATERAVAVRGRDRQLVDFAELLGERLAMRKD
jgi:cation transport ATPase